MQLVFLNSVKHRSEAFIEAYFNSKILLLHNTSQLGAHCFLFEVRMFFPPCITFIYPECNLPFSCLVIHSCKVLQWAFVLKTLNRLISSEGCHLTVQVLLQVTCEHVKQDPRQDCYSSASVTSVLEVLHTHSHPLCCFFNQLFIPRHLVFCHYYFDSLCQKPSRNLNRLCQPEDLLHKF